MGRSNSTSGRWLRLAVVASVSALALTPTQLAMGAGGSHTASTFLLPAGATNTVVSTPTSGGGYAENPPVEGGCGGPNPNNPVPQEFPNNFNANHSESELAVKPGTEQIVGSSKFFFDAFSTIYNFYLGSYNINGASHSNNIIQGYDCTTVGTQAMPPSWTNTTDPNVAFDSQGRVYQTMLPFEAFWTKLHPDGEITVSFSDDMGAHWVTGNGGAALEQTNMASSTQLGHVEDKQWVAVDHFKTLPNGDPNPNVDHVYATWDVIGGNVGSTVKLREATSRDRAQSFAPATTIVSASTDQLRDQFSQPSVDPNGDLYVAFTNIGVKTNVADFYVTKSTDDGKTFSTPVFVGTGKTIGSSRVTNTTFRDGINFAFTASQDFPGHLYLAYNDFNGTQYNVFFTQSTDGGLTWSTPARVNDDGSLNGADHFQPAVAAGPGGAVAVAFYDRREKCPADASILPADQGRSNFCINVAVQPYKDSGTAAGAVLVGLNLNASQFAWDPQQPGLLVNPDGTTTDLQTLGGLGQMACASHNDPCRLSFIGDYFGLAISGGNIYTLSVSTHYPSGVTADQGTTLYYQQQVLGTISRSSIATGF